MPSQDIILSEIAPADRDAITATFCAATGVRWPRNCCRSSAGPWPARRCRAAAWRLTEAERVQRRHRRRDRRRGCGAGASNRSGSASASPAARTAAPGPIPAISASSAGCRDTIRSMSAAISKAPASTRRSPSGSTSPGWPTALDPLFALLAASRRGGEGFGDFCHRIGLEALRQIIEGCRRKAA